MNIIISIIKKFFKRNYKKGFNAYYLLVLTIILLTIGTQSIVQYSLAKQSSDTVVVNIAGRQRMLCQKVVKEFYNCKYGDKCEYGDLKSALTSLKRIDDDLQNGNENIGILPLRNDDIKINFVLLKPYLNGIYEALNNEKNFDDVSISDLKYNEENFIKVMDEIVWQFQKESEKDIKNMMILEKYLAILSVIVVLIEIVFIVNPIINRIVKQNKKLEEIAWHQSHAFANHVKNIKDHQYVLKVEKDTERQKEIIKFVVEELDGVEEVSQFMVKALKKA
ncbi:type IV pili methyl-accepting chemotaxis transducer N-terminal domain-containing protein [uncultured Maribacter sp.]|uniref:type IV pili methyl-accepting chemotaxis transducer N-terminal domain-containing protein n=1 Tax=uncultured Maribacter sp. TaxID=431308 RepID=UPI002619FC8C|nr:type IV pili methyl-accepting chemotaxis transducer N-terminal domain-containing protein [uncultured Maribacter sp.]